MKHNKIINLRIWSVIILYQNGAPQLRLCGQNKSSKRSIHPPVSKAWGIQQSHLSLTEGCQSEAENNKLLFC